MCVATWSESTPLTTLTTGRCGCVPDTSQSDNETSVMRLGVRAMTDRPEHRVSHPWRYECPEGHRSLKFNVTVVQCQSCKHSYPREEITDLKTGRTLDARSRTISDPRGQA